MSVKARDREELPAREGAPGADGKRRGALDVSRGARRAGSLAVVADRLRAATAVIDLVLHASALQVRRISVHGNVRLSSGEVQAIVDGLRGTSILTADLAALPAAADGVAVGRRRRAAARAAVDGRSVRLASGSRWGCAASAASST